MVDVSIVDCDTGSMPQSVLSSVVGQLRIRQLGIQDYELVWKQMQVFTDQRDEKAADELWVLQHLPVFTLGQAGLEKHLINPENIPVVQCDRGGQVTYHGPGQLVVYTLVDLQRRKSGVREFVNQLEQCLIQTLSSYGIESQRKEGAPGVYVGEDKIAALGLRVRRGRAFHGISLNVNMDLTPFGRMNPCGYEGLKVIHMQTFLGKSRVDSALTVDDVGREFCRKFVNIFNYSELIGED